MGPLKEQPGPRTVADAMQYETRSLRDALKASNTRVKQAKHSTGPSYKQAMAELLIQDWQPPQVVTDLEGDHPLLSGQPGQPWFEEMRQALLTFEKTVGYNAPSKERAFWSALRTLLAEIVTSSASDQDSQLKAAWRWFSKHRPRGSHDDPGISAALAASLSIANITTATKNRGPSKQAPDPSSKPYAVTGTKHDFFNAFTRSQASVAARSGVSAPSTSAGGAAGTAGQLSSEPLRVQPDLAMVHQPAVRRETIRDAAGAKPGGRRQRSTKTEEMQEEGGRAGPLSALGPIYAPRAKACVVFDPDSTDATCSHAAEGPQGRAPSWFQGPYRPGTQHAGIMPKQGTANTRKKKEEEEDAEVEALRQKWATMEARVAAAPSLVEAQVQEWATQRARLEEEIVRRQEASRYAAPSLRVAAVHLSSAAGEEGCSSPGTPAGGNPAMQGYISAYSGVTTDAVEAVASGFQDLAHAPDALRLVPGLSPPPTTTSTAAEVRAGAQALYERDARRIAARVAELGLMGAVKPEMLAAALAPVPDRPFLECVARLPRPGENLPSRPISVRAPGKRGAKPRPRSK